MWNVFVEAKDLNGQALTFTPATVLAHLIISVDA